MQLETRGIAGPFWRNLIGLKRARWGAFLTALIVGALLLSACAPLVSPGEGTPAPSEEARAVEPSGRLQTDAVTMHDRMARALGRQLLDVNGEPIGQIEDFLVDIAAGQVLYVVVSFDAFPELEGEFFPVPVEFLSIGATDAAFLLDVSEQALTNAPRYNPEIASDTDAFTALDRNVRTYWQNTGVVALPVMRNLQPSPEQQPYYRFGTGIRLLPGTLVAFTDLLQRDVEDEQRAVLGQVEDMIFDRISAEVPYVVVLWAPDTLTPEAYLEGSSSILPMGALTWNSEEDNLIFDLDAETLADAPRFLPTGWPDLSSDQWDEDVQRFWYELSPALALRAGFRIVPDAVMRAGDLLGRSVTSMTGEDLGSLEDVIIATEDGRLAYAVLDLNGFLGLNDVYYLVPANSLTLDAFSDMAFLGIDRETLEQSPTLDRDMLREMAVVGWDRPFQEYWRDWVLPADDVEPVVEDTAAVKVAPSHVPARTLIGYSVQNSDGETLGNVEELVFDLTQGRVAYAVLSFGGFLDIGDKLFAVPMGLLTTELNLDDETVIFNVEREQLEEMPGFNQDDWPQVGNPRWRDAVRAYWTEQS